MSKPFKTFTEQIQILRSRKLIIADTIKTRKILCKENYYYVINGYKDIFLDKTVSGDEIYERNTRFEHLYGLFIFDRELKSLLLRKLLKFENNMKTKTAYYFSESFPNFLDYFNINNFDFKNSKTGIDINKAKSVSKLISNMSRVIQNGIGKKGTIEHYVNNYGYVPLWVLVKQMSFGEISAFYECSIMRVKNKIARKLIDEYNEEYQGNPSFKQKLFLSPHHLERILIFFSFYRNLCAHDERLYNYVKKAHLPQDLPLHKANKLTPVGNVFDLIITLKLFLTFSEYKKLVKELKESLARLKHVQKPKKYNEILKIMGFPKDWEDTLMLA